MSTALEHQEGGIPSLQRQEGGDHYKTGIQPWEYIQANNLDYWEGNVVKYITRWRKKGGLEDLKKAVHYIEYLIEREEKRLEDAHG